jgi:hypothetical protein
MEEQRVFKFLKDNNENIKDNEDAKNINIIIKQIINIWSDNEDIKLLLESFYYGLDSENLSLPISLPSELKPIIDENVLNQKIKASSVNSLINRDKLYINSFKQLLLMMSHFDTNLVYKTDPNYITFINLNNKFSQEIDKYYENLNNKKEGGMVLNDGKHKKYILHSGEKYQILNKMDQGILVSDKDNNVKIIDI